MTIDDFDKDISPKTNTLSNFPLKKLYCKNLTNKCYRDANTANYFYLKIFEA